MPDILISNEGPVRKIRMNRADKKNALTVAMYAALEYGPITVVSPIVAGYPLVTLLLSCAFLEKEHVGPQMIGGVAGAVWGVVLLLVT